MFMLLVVLGFGLYVATRLGETMNFLIGGGAAAAFIVLAAPHVHALAG